MTAELHPFVRLDDHVVGLQIATDVDPYLGPSTIDMLERAHAVAVRERDVHAIVLLGGARHFSAGASLGSLVARDAGANITTYVGRIPRLLLDLPVPIVAAMEGHALGGGLLLGLWCDVPVLAEESLYGANFMALGFTPGMGSTVAVEESLGGPLGRRMLYGGALLKGREIRDAAVPLSHAVTPRAEVRGRAIALAAELATSRRGPLELLKKRLSDRRRGGLEAALTEEARMHAALFAEDATREAIEARYAGKEVSS